MSQQESCTGFGNTPLHLPLMTAIKFPSHFQAIQPHWNLVHTLHVDMLAVHMECGALSQSIDSFLIRRWFAPFSQVLYSTTSCLEIRGNFTHPTLKFPGFSSVEFFLNLAS